MGQYIRHAMIDMHRIFDAINTANEGGPQKATMDGYTFGVSSNRVRTFERAYREDKLWCVTCGLKPSFFSVDSFKGADSTRTHVNLFGLTEEGEEILFTHDHIVARALGGADDRELSNTQLMCGPCNFKKGQRERKELDRRKRELINTCPGDENR